MQCKDIPTLPILRLLKSRPDVWFYWYPFQDEEDNRSIQQAMPDNVPEKLVRAKMNNLMHKGYVDGCSCGCRGDYVLTAKGHHFVDWNNRKEYWSGYEGPFTVPVESVPGEINVIPPMFPINRTKD